jgi:hypothetical protein
MRCVYRVGIHRANFADFILDLRDCYSQSHLYMDLPTYLVLWNLYYFFLAGIGLFLVLDNAGMPENRFMMDYE